MTAGKGDGRLFLRLLREARPYWAHVLLLFAVDLVSAPMVLLTPLPMKIAVDSVLGGRPLPSFLGGIVPASVAESASKLLLFDAILVVAIAAVWKSQGLVSSLLRAYTGESLVLRFRARLFGHLQRMSLAFHNAKSTADSLYRIQYDALAIEGVAISGVIPLVTAAMTLVAMVWITARLDWRLALIALAVAPVLVLFAQLHRHRLRRQWGEAKEIESSMLGVIEEALSTLRVVKAFGREEHEERRFARKASEGLRARLRALFSQGVFGLTLGIAVAAGTSAVLYFGVRHVQVGWLSLGDLVLVMFYLAMLYQPLETIGTQVAAVQSSLASAERAYSVLDQAPEVRERESARRLERAAGEVEFREVTFAYDPRRPVLRASFRVAAGARIGISGETGAGKTTLVSLLPRFYDPGEGRILLDGIDLRDYRLEDLRRQFAIVLQEPVLFSSTIEENIAYGRPGARRGEILEAARAANAHRFVEALPDGYDTLVGERGLRLSGGQRQLVSIARAFLRDAPILILDEPTSAVDVETEAAVLDGLSRLMADRTTFVVSHRPTTLAACDRWLVVEGGTIRERRADGPRATRGS